MYRRDKNPRAEGAHRIAHNAPVVLTAGALAFGAGAAPLGDDPIAYVAPVGADIPLSTLGSGGPIDPVPVTVSSSQAAATGGTVVPIGPAIERDIALPIQPKLG